MSHIKTFSAALLGWHGRPSHVTSKQVLSGEKDREEKKGALATSRKEMAVVGQNRFGIPFWLVGEPLEEAASQQASC